MELIRSTGEYMTNTFRGKNDTWYFIGTSSQINHRNPMLCIDTFRSEKGEYLEVKRQIIFEKFMDGKIIGLPFTHLSSLKFIKKLSK